eukprot:11149985-Lingulodinium_polyedra.AAC.1
MLGVARRWERAGATLCHAQQHAHHSRDLVGGRGPCGASKGRTSTKAVWSGRAIMQTSGPQGPGLRQAQPRP